MKKIFYILFILTVLSKQVDGQICPKAAGTELITNGNFSAGNTGFASDYTYSTPTVNIGNYGVGTNPNLMDAGYFAVMGDHTTGTGNMLVTDVNGTLGLDLYRTNVTVLASTTYFFSAWFANVNNNTAYFASNGKYENSPLLRFSINGVQVGATVRVDSTDHNWKQFFITWNSLAVSGPITIRIENLQPGNGGNDLGLDDISFSTSCANIGNLNTLGKTSALLDTISTCNVAFPYVLNPSLGAGYGLNWKNSGGTSIGVASTYSVASAPANGTKYYLCYDTIVGCPRTDSVIFISQFNVELGPNKIRCAPINELLTSGVATPPATVQWSLNGTPIPAGSGGTATNYTATAPGTYKLDVSRAGCGTATDQITISVPTAGFSGTGTFCDIGNTSSFSVTGTTQVKWYTVASGGTALNPSDMNPTISPAYTATNTTTPGCASGLYAEDYSSYNGSVGAASASPPCAGSSSSGNASSMMFTVYQNMTLNSVDVIQPGYGYAGTDNYVVNIYSNNPTGGPYNGGCGCTLNTKGALFFSSAVTSYSYPSITTIRTLLINASLTGVATGTIYWLEISGANYTYFNCAGAFPYIDNTGHNAIAVNKSYNYGNETTNYGNALNWNFTAGNVYSCGRAFICATKNCAAPVEWLNFEVMKSTNGNLLVWETATEKSSDYFIIEKSSDGKSFESIGNVEAEGNSTVSHSYNFIDKTTFSNNAIVYYRIVEVDLNKNKNYSSIVKLDQNVLNSTLVYPNPFTKEVKVQMISNEKEYDIIMLNGLGEILCFRKGLKAGEIYSLGQEFVSGFYFLKIMTGSTIEIVKLNKE